MKLGNAAWAAILAVLCALLYGIVVFNKISQRDEAVSKAWAALSGPLDERYGALSELARAIVLYTSREDEVTADILKDGEAYARARTIVDKAAAANEIELDLDRIAVEAGQHYPGIESYYQFAALMEGFRASERRIAPALDAYDEAVDRYNEYIRKFPPNLLAAALGFPRGVYIKSGR